MEPRTNHFPVAFDQRRREGEGAGGFFDPHPGDETALDDSRKSRYAGRDLRAAPSSRAALSGRSAEMPLVIVARRPDVYSEWAGRRFSL